MVSSFFRIGVIAAASAVLAVVASCPARAADSYDLAIKGVGKEMRAKLELISELARAERDYPTLAALRRAAERDAKAFDDALRAAGFYTGKAAFAVDRPAEENAKPSVVFTIETGPKFKVTEYEILYTDEAEGRPKTLKAAGVETTGSAAGADIQNVQLAFLNHLWESGFPAAAIRARRAIALPDKGEATAVLVFESGPKAHFGALDLRGLEKTKPDYLERLKTWDDGEEYERDKMVAYRDRLGETGVFSSIDVSPGEPDADGAAPIIVDVTERKRRTIGAGLSYSTVEGPGGRLFFQNRNMFGRGETLDIELTGSEIQQAIDFGFRKPYPGLPGYAFANFGFENDTTDAYDARSIALSGGLSKDWLDKRLTTRGAIALETSKVESAEGEERTYFLSAPLSVIWDSENDLLAPKKGAHAALTVTPYTGTETFMQAELSGRSRAFFGPKDRFTVAGRASLGGTIGNGLFDLPVNKRYFVGGGGTVRGYAYQEAGPLNDEGDPVGGRSYATAGVEMRGKVTESLELASFVDAGTVMSSPLPDFSERFFVGYGGGFRYFTPIGPIRFDIAFPLNGRDSDDNFQFYIALGQPF